MGWRMADLRAVESLHDFMAELRGAIRRQELREDLIGWLRLSTFIAGGVKKSTNAAPPDPAQPTFEWLMGRPPRPYVDPTEQTENELEQARLEAEEREARLARAQAQLFAAQFQQRFGGNEEGPPSPPAPA